MKWYELRPATIDFLRASADLLIRGEPFPRVVAAKWLASRSEVQRLAYRVCVSVGGERTEIQLLEAAARLEEESWP